MSSRAERQLSDTAFGAGALIEAVAQDGSQSAVGALADVHAALAGRFQPCWFVAAHQAQDAKQPRRPCSGMWFRGDLRCTSAMVDGPIAAASRNSRVASTRRDGGARSALRHRASWRAGVAADRGRGRRTRAPSWNNSTAAPATRASMDLPHQAAGTQ